MMSRPASRIRGAARTFRKLLPPRGRRAEVRSAIASLRRLEVDDSLLIIRRCVLGWGRDAAMRQILDSAADHVRGVHHHTEASQRIRDAVSGLRGETLSAESLMAAETYVRASGIFAASSGITALVHHALRRRAESSGDEHHLLEATVAAIHQRDRESAVRVFRTIDASVREEALAFATVGRYLDAWQGGGEASARMVGDHPRGAEDADDSRFIELLGEGPVLVYGPGPAATLPDIGKQGWKVIRIVMPEVFVWESTEDLVAGRADVAYINHEAQSWLRGLPDDEFQDVIGRFSAIVAKKSSERLSGLHLPKLRAAWSAGPLYLTGSENTVPAIVFDVVALTDAPVAVIGTTFFASATSYRSDNQRLHTYFGVRIDSQGRTGRPLERCSMLASHNAVENRTLVANLVDSGRVTGDRDFSEVIALSDEEYLSRLDELYGVERL